MLKWTDDLVKEFCRIYSNGSSSYYGRTINEKLIKFKKDNEKMKGKMEMIEKVDSIKASGTSLQGYIHAYYNDLNQVFGSCVHVDDDKSDWQWFIKFDDDTVATIYNYKNGPNYGLNNVSPTDINCWHIGGNDKMSVLLVHEYMANKVTYNTFKEVPTIKDEVVTFSTDKFVKSWIYRKATEVTSGNKSLFLHNLLLEEMSSKKV